MVEKIKENISSILSPGKSTPLNLLDSLPSPPNAVPPVLLTVTHKGFQIIRHLAPHRYQKLLSWSYRNGDLVHTQFK